MLAQILILAFTCNAFASDLMKDFDSLGENKVLHDQAQALQPTKTVTVIQKRVVDRFKRHEFYPEFAQVTSGDNPYFFSRSAGVNYQFHFNPNWSVGLQYNYFFNELSREGKTIIEEGRSDHTVLEKVFLPELNWPKSSSVAQVNWYPIYGKLSFFEKAVVHFDVYALLGVGQIELRFNTSSLWQAGLGLGFWWSQHLTTRIEYKQQNYEADYYTGVKKVSSGEASIGIGYLL